MNEMLTYKLKANKNKGFIMEAPWTAHTMERDVQH
jgi:hypothetical protein